MREAELHTDHGPQHLSLYQTCDSVPDEGVLHQLRTIRYAYTLRAEGEEEPWARWEYERIWPENTDRRWCRHHLQGNQDFCVNPNASPLNLNELHLPTGYVPFEDVIRFCIVDLGAALVPGDHDWHEILEGSYRKFRTEFAPMPD